ncbi:unnamed protein product [Tilletia laevis]|uniref:Integrase catalytic domain-containing protein n=2 Tax=Tilletia TaxID=13289 RepID=A0A177VCW8_9BASI|nr:hypothetical protein CF336_g3148 [Tilletia laevis]KAE8205376.1 hypothetical protein CF335_g2324 [Tilletia laevis]KAE8262688.1 hypothetical protein A4X03_0g2262 [Tilletia caries]CAD6896882.1 unnamed protein product [Tilletia caries]CAD6925523.1 unnamed protein product [Tilletia laevis]
MSLNSAEAEAFRHQFHAFVEPIEAFVRQPDRDLLLLPVHLEAIQESFDLVAPFALVLSEQTYNAASACLTALRSQLEQLQHDVDEPGPTRHMEQLDDGNWAIFIDPDTLAELCELRLTDIKIAALLGCSSSTIKRRRAAAGISKRRPPMEMEDLCQAIEEVRRMGTGEAGERCLTGALIAVGVSIRRAKIREAVRVLDPFPLPPRWRTALQRRTYYVPFVNSLWHLDGHHKLIRWRLVIHGCIDGKTRTVTYMRAHSNNAAASVSTCFSEAIEKWGPPSRVRADYGGENLGVKEIMEHYRGLGRGSFIQGSSTHNQRIERLWVDLQRLTTDKYRRVFEHLEAERLLDTTNPIHLWALHFVYLPQLNHALDHFAELWNNHPIRTKGLGNKSPLQLRAEGVLEARMRGIEILSPLGDDSFLEEGLRNFASYGVDLVGQTRARRDDDPHVHIDAIDHLLPPALLDPELQIRWRQQLPASWPPSEDFGIESYCQLLQIIHDYVG